MTHIVIQTGTVESFCSGQSAVKCSDKHYFVIFLPGSRAGVIEHRFTKIRSMNDGQYQLSSPTSLGIPAAGSFIVHLCRKSNPDMKLGYLDEPAEETQVIQIERGQDG